MSPELLLLILKNSKEDNFKYLDLIKTNIFSLGIILIQLFLLIPEKDI